jgi:hypothetical protein
MCQSLWESSFQGFRVSKVSEIQGFRVEILKFLGIKVQEFKDSRFQGFEVPGN